MNLRFLLSAPLLLLVLAGPSCSSDDSTGKNEEGQSDSGTGGSSASGGSTGTGGVTCDSSDCCRSCLSGACPSDADECFGNASCTAAYAEYQTCVKSGTGADRSGCYSAFVRAITADAGVDAGSSQNAGLAGCIVTQCSACGAPGLF